MGTGTKLLIVYVPRPRGIVVTHLTPQTEYSASLFNPVAGGNTDLGKIKTDADGSWTCQVHGLQARLGGCFGKVRRVWEPAIAFLQRGENPRDQSFNPEPTATVLAARSVAVGFGLNATVGTAPDDPVSCHTA